MDRVLLLGTGRFDKKSTESAYEQFLQRPSAVVGRVSAVASHPQVGCEAGCAYRAGKQLGKSPSGRNTSQKTLQIRDTKYPQSAPKLS